MTMNALAIFERAYDNTLKLNNLLNYARAFTAAVRRTHTGAPRAFAIDGLCFVHRRDIVVPTDLSNGNFRHTLIFELEGDGKLYRMTIEPVKETHQ